MNANFQNNRKFLDLSENYVPRKLSNYDTIGHQMINSTLLAQTPSRTALGSFNLQRSIFYVDPNTGNLSLRLSFNQAISIVIAALTLFGSGFFLIQIFAAALTWINAGGNENTIAAARQKILNAITGIIIIVAGYAIVAILAKIIGIEFLNPLSNLNTVSSPPATCTSGIYPCASEPNPDLYCQTQYNCTSCGAGGRCY